MGGGGDGKPSKGLSLRSVLPIDKLQNMSSLKDDLTVLRHMWFPKKATSGADHAARLETFYGPQAKACE